MLIIGGGIANFTNVATTFRGIVKALAEYKEQLKSVDASIFVRRGGPNYQEGLRMMHEAGSHLELPLHVFGPDSHMTAIVSYALGITPIPDTAYLLLESSKVQSFYNKMDSGINRNSSNNLLKELTRNVSSNSFGEMKFQLGETYSDDENASTKKCKIEIMTGKIHDHLSVGPWVKFVCGLP